MDTEQSHPNFFCFDDLTNPVGRAYARDLAAYLFGRERIERAGVRPSPKEIAAHEAGHAVVMHTLGCRTISAEINSSFGGVVTLADDDELRASWAFSDLALLTKAMQVLASGYVGERVLHAPVTFSSGHELGLMLYLGQIIGLHHGITATAAVLATINECEDVLTKNKGQGLALAGLLLERGRLNEQEIKDVLAGVERREPESWLTLANSGGGRRHPDIEQMLRFANLVAGCGWQTYSECYGESNEKESMESMG